MFSKNPPEITNKIKDRIIAIAGCGGLGSNIAISLARCGIENFILADFDRVEKSNLNRQHFFLNDIGELKTKALSKYLLQINPNIKLKIHNLKVTKDNLANLFSSADILLEAFDKAESKKMLIQQWLEKYPEKPVISGSGISGYGATAKLKIKELGNLYICGDGSSKEELGFVAPRVALVANMQANLALEILLR